MTELSKTDEFSKFRRMKSPDAPRPGETIEGGFIVVERTPGKRRLRPASWPFEVASMREAVTSVERLCQLYPDRNFAILQQVAIREADRSKK